MNYLKFDPNYVEWKRRYDTEPVYTRRQTDEMLKDQAKKMIVNRVIRSLDGTSVGPTTSVAMQILAIHQTEEGVVVIVR